MASRTRWLDFGAPSAVGFALTVGIAGSFGGCVLWTEHRERADATVRPTGVVGTGGDGGVGGATGGSTAGGGGAGAEGGSGGTGGSGGAGPEGCMPATEYNQVFDLETLVVCLVAKYEASLEIGFFTSPTWGRHEGPLTASYAAAPTDSATITRWQLPVGQAGELTAETTTIPLGIASSPVYFGAQATDLPFGDWTLLSWTGDWGSSDGEAMLVSIDGVQERQPTLGLFGAVGLAGDGTHRLVFSGLGSFGDNASPPQPGLYSADFCPGPAACATGLVAAWGEANGPVAADSEGNIFAVQTSYSTGDQAVRGFRAADVAPGAAATDGDAMLTLPGFGSELAAVAQEGGRPGLLFFQPFDATTFLAGDVVMLPYAVYDDQIATTDGAIPAVTMAEADTAVSLMTDGGNRLWLGVVTEPGRTTFYVLDRTPAP